MDTTFDIRDVAKRIKDARIKKDLTQMNLADEMGVSYQAVSNWERGNSMPDISKLRELCGILDISIDYLLSGEMSAAVKKAIDNMEGKPTKMTAEELSTAATLLPPSEAGELTEEVMAVCEEISLSSLCTLAPHIDESILERIADKVEKVDLSGLIGLAPFLRDETVDRLAARITDSEIDPCLLTGLAPFVNEQTLDKLVDRVQYIDVVSLTGLAPFLGDSTVDKLAAQITDGDTDPHLLLGLAPFLSRQAADKLAERITAIDFNSLSALAPFLSQQTVNTLAAKINT